MHTYPGNRIPGPDGFAEEFYQTCCFIAKSYLTLYSSTDCNIPGSSVHGILQARILEWVAMPSSRGSSQSRDGTRVSCIDRQIIFCWVTREEELILIPKNWRVQNTPKSTLQGWITSITLISKTIQRLQQKKITGQYLCWIEVQKSSKKKKISKLNSTIYNKNDTVWSSWIYSRNIRMVQYLQSNQ